MEGRGEFEQEMVGQLGHLTVHRIHEAGMKLMVDSMTSLDIVEVTSADLKIFDDKHVLLTYGASIWGCIAGVLLLENTYYIFHSSGNGVTRDTMRLLENQLTVGYLGGNKELYQRLLQHKTHGQFSFLPSAWSDLTHPDPENETGYNEPAFDIAIVPKQGFMQLPSGIYASYFQERPVSSTPWLDK